MDDWLTDPALSKCEPATRGIWADALCAMAKEDRSGVLHGSLEQLAQVLRATPAELRRALNDIKATKTADLRVCNRTVDGHVTMYVTLINRRMRREWKARKHCSERVSKHRAKADVTTPVTVEKQKCNAGELEARARVRVQGARAARLPPVARARARAESGSAAPLSDAQLIFHEKGLKRVEKRVEQLWNYKSQWDDKEREEYKTLKFRRKEIMKLLGMTA